MRLLNVTASVGAFFVFLATVLVFILTLFNVCAGYLYLVSAMFQIIFFMLQQFRAGADGFCSMMQWTYYTILWWNCMVTVPLKVQVSMCRFPLYCGLQTSFFIWYNEDIQEGYGSILSCLFTSKLYVIIYTVRCSRKLVFWDDWMIVKVSSTNPLQKLGGCGAEFMALISNSHPYKFATMGPIGDPMAAPSCCSKYLPWKMK